MLPIKLLLLYVLATRAQKERLTLTALLSDDHGNLRFECWAMSTPFTEYPTIGKAVLAFAETSNVSYVILPPRSSEGYHRPPHPMLFVLLSGLAHVTIPGHSEEELWIAEGMNGVMIAADVVGDGHVTDYPLDKETHALQIPFGEKGLPEHVVVRDGVCLANVEKVSNGENAQAESKGSEQRHDGPNEDL